MKKFMHVGVPTDKIMDTPLPEELQTLVHVAYQVDDMDEQLKANRVVVEPWMADENTRIAFIMKDGILMELMEVK